MGRREIQVAFVNHYYGVWHYCTGQTFFFEHKILYHGWVTVSIIMFCWVSLQSQKSHLGVISIPLHVCIALTSCVTGAPNIICLPYHTPFPFSFSTCVVTSFVFPPNSRVPLFLIWVSVKSNTLSPTCSEEVKCTLSLIFALHVR